MELEEYAKLIPPAPTDLVKWVKEQGYLNENYLIYREEWVYVPLEDRKKRGAVAVCTACGAEFGVDKLDAGGCSVGMPPAPYGIMLGNHAVIDGDTEMCPECHAPVRVTHCSKANYVSGRCCYPLVISRVGKRLVLACWQVSAWTEEKERRMRYVVRKYEAYVAEEKKIVRVSGCTRNIGGGAIWHGWEARARYADLLGSGNLIYPMDAHVADGTFVENAKLVEYIRDAGEKALPVSYLRLYQKHHNAENLVTDGLSKLLSEMMQNEAGRTGYYNPPRLKVPKLPAVNWKAKKPHEMLHMTKEQLRLAKKNGWSARDFELWKSSKELNAGLMPEEVQKDPLRIRTLFAGQGTIGELQRRYGLTPAELVKYLRRQHRRDERADMTIFDDYIRMAKCLGIGLDDRSVLLPYDLIRFHDRAAAAMEGSKTQARARDFAEMAELLAPLAWEADGICIRPAQSQKELSCEGAALHHCVGTYGKAHCEGKSIFFIRHADAPDEPWFTLNLDVEKGTVIQNRGLKNCARTPEISDFEKRWLREVVEPWMAGGKNPVKKLLEARKQKENDRRAAMARSIEQEARHGQTKGEAAA